MKLRRGTNTALSQLQQTSEADDYWSKLNEISLFANDFLISKFAHVKDDHDFEPLTFLENLDNSENWSSIVEDVDLLEKDMNSENINISQFFAEILDISSSIANSSFASLHYRRIKLLRKMQEACFRKKQENLMNTNKRTTAINLGNDGDNDFDNFTYVAHTGTGFDNQPVLPSGGPPAPKDGPETPDPIKQTLESLYSLLENANEENLRDNNTIQKLLQLFSDLPPYSLFHSKHPALNTFEELLVNFLKSSGTKEKSSKDLEVLASPNSNRRWDARPNIYTQGSALLLVLALMRGSIRTSLYALSFLLQLDVNKEKEEKENTNSNSNSNSKQKNKGKQKKNGTGTGEENIPSAIPYLKQLEDYRKHQEISSLYENTYLGVWKYHWKETTGLYSYGSTRNQQTITFACIATDGAYLYILNKDGLSKIGTGYKSTLKGHVYNYRPDYLCIDKGWLVYLDGTLYYRSIKDVQVPFVLKRINCNSLEEENDLILSLGDGGLDTPFTPTSHIPLISDGRYLFLLSEVRKPGSTPGTDYKLFTYDPVQEGCKCISVITLKGPHTLTGQHAGVVCEGCQRAGFRGKRYKCTVSISCRDYNLCHTCKQLGIVTKQHHEDHNMEDVPEPKSSGTVAPAALTPQAITSGYFFITGFQLGVILPAGIAPNNLRRSKSMCRIFDLRQGRHVHDLMVENWNYGICVSYDKENNLLWTHSPDSYSVMRWSHTGRTSPTFEATDPVTVLTKHSLPTNMQQSIAKNKAAMVLLGNIDILAKRICPCRKDQIAVKHPFCVETNDDSSELFSGIYSILAQCTSILSASDDDEQQHMDFSDDQQLTTTTTTTTTNNNNNNNNNNEGADTHIYVMSAVMRLLKTNLYHFSKSPKFADAVNTVGLVLFDIRDLLLKIATDSSFLIKLNSSLKQHFMDLAHESLLSGL